LAKARNRLLVAVQGLQLLAEIVVRHMELRINLDSPPGQRYGLLRVSSLQVMAKIDERVSMAGIGLYRRAISLDCFGRSPRRSDESCQINARPLPRCINKRHGSYVSCLRAWPHLRQ
jgi:hypothetical protein